MSDITTLIARVRNGDPVAASALADLVECDLFRAGFGVTSGTEAPSRRRGGDKLAGTRAVRNEGIRDFAALLGSDLLLEQRAQQVIREFARFRPNATDENRGPKRQALRRIIDTGLPIPGLRQVKRIIGGK
jgi:hypothetical protein